MNFKETLQAIPFFHKIGLVPLLLGHTGIGKTQLAKQYAESIGYDLLVIHVAQMEPSDFTGLPKAIPTGKKQKITAQVDGKPQVFEYEIFKTTHCQPNFLPENQEKGCIILLDEINRGHEDMRQALYQFIQEGRIHTYMLPKNCYMIAAANPSEGYEVNEFDNALVSRFAWINFKPNALECISHIENKLGKNIFTTWVKGDESLLDYGNDFAVKGLLFPPRMLEFAAKLHAEIKDHSKIFQRKMFECIMPKEKVASFIAFLDEIDSCSIQEVLLGKKVKEVGMLLEKKRVDVLSALTQQAADIFQKCYINDVPESLKGSDMAKVYKNLATFLDTIPTDLCLAFVENFDKFDEKREQHVYFQADVHDVLKKRLIKFKDISAKKAKS